MLQNGHIQWISKPWQTNKCLLSLNCDNILKFNAQFSCHGQQYKIIVRFVMGLVWSIKEGVLMAHIERHVPVNGNHKAFERGVKNANFSLISTVPICVGRG